MCADWTSISNANVEPDAPWISATAFALRDNPIAIAEGALGAPRIQNEAMDADSVDNANVVNGTLGAEKFQTGTAERDWVLARTAASSLGALGTYAFLFVKDKGAAETYVPGSTQAGSNLEYSDSNEETSGVEPAGTWECRGKTSQPTTGTSGTTLWLRIS